MYYRRGECYSGLRKNDLAIEDFNQAIFWDARYIRAYLGRADVNLLEGNYKEVLSDVEKFSTEYNVKVQYDYNSFKITKE